MHWTTILAALVSVVHCSDVNLCNHPCPHNSQFFIDNCHNVTEGNCCRLGNDGPVIGIDLRDCGMNSSILSDDVFINDPVIRPHLDQMLFIDLSGANFDGATKLQNLDGLRGMTSLQSLLVPEFFVDCPGHANSWNITDKSDKYNARMCQEPTDSCQVLKFDDCPTPYSVCAPDGPSLLQCICADGYWGYKCLKYGHFPYIWFFSILAVFTVVVSALLWFTQRRHVKKSQ